MKFPVNLELFADTQHSPSIFALAESMNAAPGSLRDYCIPVNSYFPTPEVFANLRKRFETILKFYPSSNADIGARLSTFVGLDPDTLVLGNGSTELISFINRLLVKESLAIPVPTFSRWTADPVVSGKRVHTFMRRPEKNFRLTPAEFVAGVLRNGARAAVLCNPNNPTGALMSRADVLTVLDALADLDVVVIDESFIDFAQEDGVPSVDRDVARFPNAVVLKSLGKNLGLHGLRMGYAVGHPDLVAKLRAAIPFWNINSVAQALIEELPAVRHEYENGRRKVVRDRVYLERRLRTVPGLTVYPSEANFVYVRMPEGIEGVALRNQLLVEHGCLLRECGNKEGSDSRHFRIAARPAPEIDFLIESLGASFSALGRAGYTIPAPPRESGANNKASSKARIGAASALLSPASSPRFRRKLVLGTAAAAAGLLLGIAVSRQGGAARNTPLVDGAIPSAVARASRHESTALSESAPASVPAALASDSPGSVVGTREGTPAGAGDTEVAVATAPAPAALEPATAKVPTAASSRQGARAEAKRKMAKRRAARQRRLRKSELAVL